MRYEVFREAWISGQDLFDQAAQFAAQIGPERLISISHSEDGNEGVVTVWYWAAEEDAFDDQDRS